jgi:hypothetical protein
MSVCVVFFCNKPFLDKFFFSCNQLITNGKYNGDICLFIGDDLNNSNITEHPFIQKNKIIIKYFPEIKFTENFLKCREEFTKNAPRKWPLFMFNKLNVFNLYFKNWNYILYLDCGMHIFNDINPLINLKEENKFLANRDGIDGEDVDENLFRTLNNENKLGNAMKLHAQFFKNEPYYSKLKANYDVYKNAPQATMFLFDTNIIKNDTLSNLINLAHQYPILKTGDQPLIALYFTQIKPCWKQLKRKINNIYTYDLVRCVREQYIMVKYPQTTNELDRGYFVEYTGQTLD